MIKKIFEFISDIPKAIKEITNFITEFFKMLRNIINILPQPFNQITLLGIGIIITIYVVKIVRGS